MDKAHEFYRPWMLWKRVYEVAPEPARAFARGLWDHQIQDQDAGAFSCHARWFRHPHTHLKRIPKGRRISHRDLVRGLPGTRDPVYVKAVETLVDMYDRLSSRKSKATPCASDCKLSRIIWPESNRSLAVDLPDSAPPLDWNDTSLSLVQSIWGSLQLCQKALGGTRNGRELKSNLLYNDR